MRSNNNFVALLFFSIMGIVATIVYSSVMISKMNAIESQMKNK